MYKVPSPAMVCNASNLGGFLDYKMWNTRTVTQDVPPASLVANIVSVAKSAPDGYLAALVLHSHGNPGYLDLGTGIFASTAPLFASLKGLVGDIYIVGCSIAGFRKNKAHTGYLDGSQFCIALAKNSGAYVYAPKVDQSHSDKDRRRTPFGYIDDYEGEVLVFLPDGSSQSWNKEVPLARRKFGIVK